MAEQRGRGLSQSCRDFSSHPWGNSDHRPKESRMSLDEVHHPSQYESHQAEMLDGYD